MSVVKRLFQLDFTRAAGHRKMPTAYLADNDKIHRGRFEMTGLGERQIRI